MSITAALRLEIYMQSYGNDVLVSVLVLYPAREGCGAGSGRSVWGNDRFYAPLPLARFCFPECFAFPVCCCGRKHMTQHV